MSASFFLCFCEHIHSHSRGRFSIARCNGLSQKREIQPFWRWQRGEGEHILFPSRSRAWSAPITRGGLRAEDASQTTNSSGVVKDCRKSWRGAGAKSRPFLPLIFDGAPCDFVAGSLELLLLAVAIPARKMQTAAAGPQSVRLAFEILLAAIRGAKKACCGGRYASIWALPPRKERPEGQHYSRNALNEESTLCRHSRFLSRCSRSHFSILAGQHASAFL